eukprot:174189-Ditylum_brightwellii.AAC.1
MNTKYHNKKAFTLPLVPIRSKDSIDQNNDEVNYTTEDGLRTIWHQGLCHTHNVSNLHHFVDGIPKVKNPTDIGKCDTCLTCKIRKAVKGNGHIRKYAEVTGQGLSLDWGFMAKKSKNQDRVEKLTAIDGSQSYLLVVDHHSNQFWPLCSDSKSPPLSWLNCLLTKTAPDYKNKYVCMDLSSELGRNIEVKKLLTKHGYDIRPTSPNTSHQSSPGERPHETIGDAVRSMLEGSGLPEKFWSHALYNYAEIHSYLPHCKRDKTPHEIVTGNQPDISKLKTFGCRVYVRPP